MKFLLALPMCLVLASLGACSPTLDWRETAAEGSGVVAMFPCRPDRHDRAVRLVGTDLRMQMHSCRAANASFSLTYVDAAQPAQVGRLLEELHGRAVSNIAGVSAGRPFAVPGATPNERSAQWRIEGRLPDGRGVTEHAAFFVKGSRVYQASALGEAVSADAVETFFGAIRVTP